MTRLRAVYDRLPAAEREGAKRLLREHPAWALEFLEDKVGIVRPPTRARAKATVPTQRRASSSGTLRFRRADGCMVTLTGGTATELAARRSDMDRNHPRGSAHFNAEDPRARIRHAVFPASVTAVR